MSTMDAFVIGLLSGLSYIVINKIFFKKKEYELKGIKLDRLLNIGGSLSTIFHNEFNVKIIAMNSGRMPVTQNCLNEFRTILRSIELHNRVNVPNYKNKDEANLSDAFNDFIGTVPVIFGKMLTGEERYVSQCDDMVKIIDNIANFRIELNEVEFDPNTSSFKI